MALAYFITFTTYGTWLHGSARGSVDDTHNIYGTKWLDSSAERERHARRIMKEEPYVMGAMEREIVCQAIVGLARARNWSLWAVHVRSNHVHVVVTGDRAPERVMADMKARASRDLARAGFGTPERRRWTRHGSTRHLFREEEIEAKIRYTLDGQGTRMAWYDGRDKEPRTE